MNFIILKNKEFKLTVIMLLITALAFTGISMFFTYYTWNRLSTELVNRNISLMGNLLSQHPELERQIAGSFTGQLSEEDYNKGLTAAEKYGYNSKLPLNIVPIINSAYKNSSRTVVLVLVLQLLMVLFVICRAFNYIYKYLTRLTLGTEKIMGGNFDIKFADKGEGVLPLLGFQFNQMASRLQLTLEELKVEKELMKNMVSNISHQLKTPLSSLRMFNELLIDGAAENPAIREEFLQKSTLQLERMEWLIQTLLKISRLEVGAIDLNKSGSDLCRTIMDTIEYLEPKWRNKRQHLEFIKSQSAVIMSHDPKWLGEAFENIIGNAINYTAEEGKIIITLDESDSTIELTVKDSGIGIPQQDLPYVFERFYQSSKTKKLTSKGSGIGLSLAKLVIEKHDGFIRVSSRESQGTTFIITFPKALTS